MQKQSAGLFFIVCCITFAGGCAKHEMVKADETPAAAAIKQPVKPAAAPEQSASRPQGKAEAMKGEPAAQSLLKNGDAHDALNPMRQAGELQAAMDKIYFDFDAYTLSEEAREILVKNAEIMKKDPAVKVSIEGNCDERGSDEYNLALGERRARAAMKYLVTMGIPAERLSVISYGKEKPADPGRDEAAWAKNRRDEFVAR